MHTNWFLLAPMVGVAVLIGFAMILVTGRADRSVRRAQSLRERTLHEEIF